MTFGSDRVQQEFALLPLQRQKLYSDWSAELASRKQALRIEGIVEYGSILEVIVRITDYAYRTGAAVSPENP